MSEINNLPQLSGRIEKKPQIQHKHQEECIPSPENECCCPQCEITHDRGVLGQSQVKKPENIKSDIEFCTKNPELIEICDKYFDMVLDELTAKKDPEAYEKACVLTDAFAKEFTN